MEQDYESSDMLMNINKSQDIQSHLLQGGLSPITPADPVGSKPWPVKGASLPYQVLHGLSSSQAVSAPLLSVVTASGITSRQVTSSVNPYITQAPILSEALAGLSGTHSSQRAQVSTSSAQASYGQPTGFTPVVLPSGGHRSRSPHRVPNAPVATSHTNISRSFDQAAGSQSSQMTLKQERVYPDKELSVTQPGPPNITISTCTSIPSQEKPAQKLPRNPFTFPATPPVSLTNEKTTVHINQSNSVVSDGLTNDKQRHASDEMPHLSPVAKEKKEIKEENADNELVPLVSIWMFKQKYFKNMIKLLKSPLN